MFYLLLSVQLQQTSQAELMPAHATHISSHESLSTPTTVAQHAPATVPHGTSVHAAHSIARVHDENKNIVLLLIKIVKFVKYFFDLIISTFNTLNE